MATMIVHYAVVTPADGVMPLCGDWGISTSWTTVAEAVSCPRCRSRLFARASPTEALAPELSPRARR